MKEIQVYIGVIENIDEDPSKIETICHDQDRCRRAAGYHKSQDRLRSIYAGVLQEQVLALYAKEQGTKPMTIAYTSQGKPYVESGEAVLSVSHSANLVCVAIADGQDFHGIGVDIEGSRQLHIGQEAFSRKICHEDERTLFARKVETSQNIKEDNESNESELIRLWTLKESYLKCIGTGLDICPSSFSMAAAMEKTVIDDVPMESECQVPQLVIAGMKVTMIRLQWSEDFTTLEIANQQYGVYSIRRKKPGETMMVSVSVSPSAFVLASTAAAAAGAATSASDDTVGAATSTSAAAGAAAAPTEAEPLPTHEAIGIREDIEQAFKPTPWQDSKADYLLRTAMDLGEHLLLCGADIHRVEDTIIRVCKTYGAVHVEAFSITSLVVASVRMADGEYSSQIRRVYNCSNNFASMEELNHISRELCDRKITLEQAGERIVQVKDLQPYPNWAYYVAGALASASFTIFFGGNLWDALAALIAGTLVTFVDRHQPDSINQMARMVVESFFAGIIAILLVYVGIGTNTDKIMIGVIMLLVPGIAFGNSMQDLLKGDLISGSLKLVQAILLAVMIALGFAFAMVLLGGLY